MGEKHVIEAKRSNGELDWALREFYELADLTKPEVWTMRSIRPLWKRLLDGVPVLPRELAALLSWKWQPDPVLAPDFPVLLVSGEETCASLYPTIETLREALPHAEIAMIAGQRHMATAFSPGSSSKWFRGSSSPTEACRYSTPSTGFGVAPSAIRSRSAGPTSLASGQPTG